ncbi:MAG: hypothetical protein U1F76_29100 [Candidatus Competibacteraceae bacterium]
MSSFLITDKEWLALADLPHLARLVYFVLRRYMDYRTGLVGPVRAVSLQAIAEELNVPPRPGIRGGKPSRKEVRHALEWLERAGLVVRNTATNKTQRQLILTLGVNEPRRP